MNLVSQYIVEFGLGGPKNYGYWYNDDKTECKVKGHSLNVEGMAQPNYEVLRQNTLDELQHSLETPWKTPFIKGVKSSANPNSTKFVPSLPTKTVNSSSTNASFDLGPQ